MGLLAINAKGTQFQMGDGGGPETFTTVAEVMDIGGPALSSDTTDTTSHDSASGFEDVLPTILRTGEVTFNINYVPTHATHNATTGLVRDYRLKTRRNYRLIFPDSGSTTWSFAGYVTGFNVNAPVADRLNADVTIKITGAPTLA